jgi:hypothetical protein
VPPLRSPSSSLSLSICLPFFFTMLYYSDYSFTFTFCSPVLTWLLCKSIVLIPLSDNPNQHLRSKKIRTSSSFQQTYSHKISSSSHDLELVNQKPLKSLEAL